MPLLLIPPRMYLSAKSAVADEARLFPSTSNEVQRLVKRDRELMEQAIDRFAEKGIGDVKVLAGAERQYRLRAGDWRIRFLVEPQIPSAFFISDIEGKPTVRPSVGPGFRAFNCGLQPFGNAISVAFRNADTA